MLDRLCGGPVERARVLLAAADEVANPLLGGRFDTSVVRVSKWLRRYSGEGLAVLGHGPRSGRPRMVDDIKIVTLTLSRPPKASGLETWLTRKIAKRSHIGKKRVARVWKRWRMYPWRDAALRFTTDPELEAEVNDVVERCLDPSGNAVVLGADDKAPIQALDRTAPILPRQPGLIMRRLSNYVRHGTITLSATLDVTTGQVTAQIERSHRDQEFLAFPRRGCQGLPGRGAADRV